jgi:ribulose-5-phosphate 4-epimerase/fuculose-1-phosphate aldolase
MGLMRLLSTHRTPSRSDSPRARLAQAYEVLHALGLFDYAGDVSIREPGGDGFLIRRARIAIDQVVTGDPTRTTAGDIVMVDFAGQLMQGRGPLPIETSVHAAIYAARPAIESVVHAHPRMTVALSIGGRTPEPVFIRGADVTDATALTVHASSSSIRSREAAQSLLQAMGDASCCLLPGHGVVIVADTLELACLRLVNLEQSSTMQFLATMVGEPRLLAEDSLKQRQRTAFSGSYVAGIWRYYVALAQDRDGLGAATRKAIIQL